MQMKFDALMAHVRQTEALSQVSGLLGWDQETMMPRGAAQQRAEWMGAMETTIHARRTDPAVGEWLAAIDVSGLDQVAQANVREIKRDYERTVKVPAELAAEIARVTSVSQGVWAEARGAEDVAAFAPTLKQVLGLKRELASALADGGDLYDAMIEDYEPGMKGADLSAMLGKLRVGLVDLKGRVEASSRVVPTLDFEFAEDKQMALGAELAGVFGYDWDRGRMDKAVHPFSSGSGMDSRITTRVDLQNPFNCFYSVIHEVGHSSYEQGVDPQHLLTPLGRGVSMGVHESQSRILENQLGRSAEFSSWLYGRMRDVFGDFGISNEDDFYAYVNKVGKGFIRTEADEVQYNLHVLLRFDLERAMISGDLEVDDLEAAWNDRFKADFGFDVDRPSNGVLQDVHWSVGLFGYFPTYSLGNVYAGELYDALRVAVPSLDVDLAAGETGAAKDWLQANVHQHGGLYAPAELVEKAVGHAPSEAPLLAYLDRKFAGIYGL